MTTLALRDPAALFNELMAWAATPGLHDIRVEEFVEDGRRVVRADLPGVDPDKDIAVSVRDGMLRITGERRREEHEQARTEIRYGKFERVVGLPGGITSQDVSAAYRDGVLTVSFPERTAETETQIPIDRADTTA